MLFIIIVLRIWIVTKVKVLITVLLQKKLRMNDRINTPYSGLVLDHLSVISLRIRMEEECKKCLHREGEYTLLASTLVSATISLLLLWDEDDGNMYVIFTVVKIPSTTLFSFYHYWGILLFSFFIIYIYF